MSEDKFRGFSEALAELAVQATDVLIESGMEEERAIELGLKIIEKYRKHCGGEYIYIAKGCKYDLSQRDAAMLAEYNGSNRMALCQKYNITKTRFLQIVKAKRDGRVSQTTLAEFIDD